MIGILAFGRGFTSKFVSTRHTQCSRLAAMPTSHVPCRISQRLEIVLDVLSCGMNGQKDGD